MKMTGKIALITGGGTGIGAAIAERFVTEGAKVCVTGRRQEILDKFVHSLPTGTAVTCSGDVSKEEDATRMVSTAIHFGGKLDVLVNNAGIGAPGAVVDVDLGDWRKVMEVNLTGPFLLMKAAIPHMITNGGGSIINISSVGGMRCLPNRVAYCTSKAALIMLTKQAALDYGPYRIRCNAVCPGGVRTAMTEHDFGPVGKLLGMDSDTFFSTISSNIPLRRFGNSSEISGLCAYLASDESSFTTGAEYVVDGGTSIVSVVGASITNQLKKLEMKNE
ncbi:MAG: SDR family oxidoreductase [Desulfobacteraceae bacterium]|nr:MAG: SDR family oxidoreductase [Desulfobacteraceae bacterium]